MFLHLRKNTSLGVDVRPSGIALQMVTGSQMCIEVVCLLLSLFKKKKKKDFSVDFPTFQRAEHFSVRSLGRRRLPVREDRFSASSTVLSCHRLVAVTPSVGRDGRDGSDGSVYPLIVSATAAAHKEQRGAT